MNKIETILKENRVNYETAVETHERVFGKNSCFLVGENYRSYYDDDYCSFTYYSNVTGEYFTDNWTTAAACPSYSLYETDIRFDKAKELGLIDIKIFNSVWKVEFNSIGEYLIKWPKEFIKCYGRFPMVEVYRGRSFKGRKGYLVEQKTINKDTRWPAEMAIIYDTEAQEFFMVKIEYIRIPSDFDKTITEAFQKRIDEEMMVEDRMRKFNKDDQKEIIDELFFNGNWTEYRNNMYDMFDKFWTKYKYDEEHKKYAPSEKLLQWVREHFKDVTDEKEIYEIGFKINKKNSRY